MTLKRTKNHTFCKYPGASAVKESTCNVGDPVWLSGSGRSPGGGNHNSLQYSCLEKSHGQKNLSGCGPQGCKESDMTE